MNNKTAMTPKIRNLADSPFSISRLFVWSVGIIALVGMITMSILAYQQKEIAPQVQSATMFALGCLVARIERGVKS